MEGHKNGGSLWPSGIGESFRWDQQGQVKPVLTKAVELPKKKLRPETVVWGERTLIRVPDQFRALAGEWVSPVIWRHLNEPVKEEVVRLVGFVEGDSEQVPVSWLRPVTSKPLQGWLSHDFKPVIKTAFFTEYQCHQCKARFQTGGPGAVNYQDWDLNRQCKPIPERNRLTTALARTR